ncbi:MAG: hypothetical protein DI528_19085 [Shinella sp.]|nr:MAG: hypothetical protein DI528_19085 [Shinella sp.]
MLEAFGEAATAGEFITSIPAGLSEPVFLMNGRNAAARGHALTKKEKAGKFPASALKSGSGPCRQYIRGQQGTVFRAIMPDSERLTENAVTCRHHLRFLLEGLHDIPMTKRIILPKLVFMLPCRRKMGMTGSPVQLEIRIL